MDDGDVYDGIIIIDHILYWSSGWGIIWDICYFPYIGNNHPNWLSYFTEGLKPLTRYNICIYIYICIHIELPGCSLFCLVFYCFATVGYMILLGYFHCCLFYFINFRHSSLGLLDWCCVVSMWLRNPAPDVFFDILELPHKMLTGLQGVPGILFSSFNWRQDDLSIRRSSAKTRISPEMRNRKRACDMNVSCIFSEFPLGKSQRCFWSKRPVHSWLVAMSDSCVLGVWLKQWGIHLMCAYS